MAKSQIIIYGTALEIDNIIADLLGDKSLWDDADLYRLSKNEHYRPSISGLAKSAIQKHLMRSKELRRNSKRF